MAVTPAKKLLTVWLGLLAGGLFLVVASRGGPIFPDRFAAFFLLCLFVGLGWPVYLEEPDEHPA